MSGTMDTSTPAQRVAFSSIIESGADPGQRLQGLCAALTNCGLLVPATTAALLGFPGAATYAMCAARVQLPVPAGLGVP